MKAPTFKTIVNTPEQLATMKMLTDDIAGSINPSAPLGTWPPDAEILFVANGSRNGWDSVEELIESAHNEDYHCFYNSKDGYVKYTEAVRLLQDYLSFLKQPKFPFKPFDRVLMRQSDTGRWMPDLFAFIDTCFFGCARDRAYTQLVPFDGNEHLVNTSDSPKDSFWKIESGKLKLIRC